MHHPNIPSLDAVLKRMYATATHEQVTAYSLPFSSSDVERCGPSPLSSVSTVYPGTVGEEYIDQLSSERTGRDSYMQNRHSHDRASVAVTAALVEQERYDVDDFRVRVSRENCLNKDPIRHRHALGQKGIYQLRRTIEH